jgi:hypothetical protein
MRRTLSLAGVLVIGLAAAACNRTADPSRPTVAGTQTQTTGPTKPDQGPFVLAGGNGQLGEADYGQTKSTAFTLRNTSRKPFTVTVADKSCACAGVEVKPAEVPPGGSCEVVLSWVPKLDQPTDADVRVAATIQARAADGQTQQVKLEATGRVKPALFVNLPQGKLDFGRLTLSSLKTQNPRLSVEVFTRDPKHKGFTLQVATSTPGFKVVPTEPPRLTADRLAALKAADGYRVTLEAGEGLPVGRFRESATLKTSIYPDLDLEIPLEGTLETGAVSVFPEIVQLPEKLPIGKEYRCPPVEVKLRGEPNRTIQVKAVEPKFLHAEVEPVAGQENTWRIKVRVPGDEAELKKHLTPAQWEEYLSYGFDHAYILLQTDHSALPTLRIPVTGSQLQR